MSEYSTEDLLSDKEIPEVQPEATPSDETKEPETGDKDNPGGQEGQEPKPAEDNPTPGEEHIKPPESESSTNKDTYKEGEEEGDEGKPWTYQAVRDERAKRQAAEARIQELEKQIGGGGKKPELEKQDWLENPEAAAQAQQQDIQRALFEQRAVMGQELMRTLHDDFDEMEARFWQMVDADPQLANGIQQAANPAKFAYETAKKALEYEKMRDVDAYKASIEADIRKKVEAEMRAKFEAEKVGQQKKQDAILPTLSASTSKGGLSSDDWAGPTPLADILK
ncbi:hypothetical protein [Microbulbifer sp. 2205BS26-8]|uniref:hypothetical protein n=1 Tax=Microbulbifer sp. 2205BS26-8 TaxID=3064386 RepID=UPI00273FD516|nr:hypothetical protein [Microbulbifer sp. 2205BS26-8]MDP5211217.1 hypothetical protein [Microbulbifer sp. 2205BS26-8]